MVVLCNSSLIIVIFLQFRGRTQIVEPRKYCLMRVIVFLWHVFSLFFVSHRLGIQFNFLHKPSLRVYYLLKKSSFKETQCSLSKKLDSLTKFNWKRFSNNWERHTILWYKNQNLNLRLRTSRFLFPFKFVLNLQQFLLFSVSSFSRQPKQKSIHEKNRKNTAKKRKKLETETIDCPHFSFLSNS